MPDIATREFLRKYANAKSYRAYGKTFPQPNAGDRVIVCNPRVCTTYEMTHSRDWNGIQRNPIQGGPAGDWNAVGAHERGSRP
jgi:hypothetical protein